MAAGRPFDEWSIEETIALFTETTHVSDRVAAIACAAFVDGILLTALSRRFIKLSNTWKDKIFSGATSPLSSFSAKSRIGYALALYGPDTYRDLEIIRSIRNDFAHTAVPVSFDDLKISKRCLSLNAERSAVILTGSPTLPFEHGSPKARYIGTSQRIALGLLHEPTPASRPQHSKVLP